MQKTCKVCGKTKPLSEFRIGRKSHRADCRRCELDRGIAYRKRAENKQRYADHNKAYYAASKSRTEYKIIKRKRCTMCGVNRVRSQYSPVSSTSDGLSSRCKPCCAILTRKRYRTDDGRRKALEYAKAYVKRPEVAARLKAKAQTPEAKAYFKRYAKTTAFRENQRRYQSTENGKLSRTAISLRRRVRIRGNGDPLLTKEALKRLLDSKGRYCHYCGAKPMKLEIDHQMPIELGGTNAIENLWPACVPCNRAKGPRFWKLGCRMK